MGTINRYSRKSTRQRFKNVVPLVDNKAPTFKAETYYRERQLKFDADRCRRLDNENMDLLRSMNRFARLGTGIDCWLGNIVYKSTLPNQDPINAKIKEANEGLLQRINMVTSEYSAAGFIKEWLRMKAKMLHSRKSSSDKESSAQSETNIDYCMVNDVSLLKVMNPAVRTRCFFEVEIKETKLHLGTIIFELYDDIVPKTCANFAAFCRGTNGISYKGTPFHRIVANYWCQGGDVTKGTGIGGVSIFGESFEAENFNLRHATTGVLSMCTEKKHNSAKCDSKFNLTLKALPSMNGEQVVFGRTISGISNIYKIEEFGTKTGKPVKTVIITNCGVLAKKSRRRKKYKS